MDMFSRLKGAIDSRIAEEQARQRSLQAQQGRSPSAVRRQAARARSPAVRGDRTRDGSANPLEKGPDPQEFEQTFLIDDDEASTRAGTPQPQQDKNLEADSKVATDAKDEVIAVENTKVDASGPTTSSTNATTELPPDVRAKLRKLERLEPKWQEFLRSYKIAHARVQDIEIFEAALRESTPLTSIQDPTALTEYLNQIKVKSDMILDEMKRLSGEKDELKKKLEDAERRNKEFEIETEKLRSSSTVGNQASGGSVSGSEPKSSVDLSRTPASPKTKTPSVTSFSLFSPKTKPSDPPPVAEPEEFFSYDSEVPRLESELKSKQDEVAILQKEVKSLHDDLEVAKESTQSMAKSLEESTKEYTVLKEKHEQFEKELLDQKTEKDTKIGDLHVQLETADRKLREMELNAPAQENIQVVERQLSEHKTLLADTKAELAKLQPLEKENATLASNLSSLQGKVISLESTIERLEAEKTKTRSKAKITDELVVTLKKDISNADATRKALEVELGTKTNAVQTLEAKLVEAEEKLASSTETQSTTAPSLTTSNTQPNASAASSKKKNNKKKKGGKTATEQSNGTTNTVQETVESSTNAQADISLDDLKQQIATLTSLIQEKDASIDRLNTKIRDTDELKEEIESLRDDLITVGQDHVTAKDKLKELEAEKKTLEAKISELEHDLENLRSSQLEHSTGSQQAHNDLTDEHNKLKTTVSNLETDLAVAQQLASSRFKDLTDLRGVLQKAQPELSALRKENSDLSNMKTELTSRVEELQKVETRQTTLRSELADVRRRLGEKDSETKALQQKLTQEASSKQRSEEENSKITQDLQKVEREKSEIVQNLERTSTDLSKAKEDLRTARIRIGDLEEKLNKAQRESASLKEDIQLKTAQYASAESLMNSMRDQTSEMATQTKEASERVESLEEEIAEARRLLNERNREAETMRRLLAEVEGRADTRVREMKERLDTALEERDKAEDEASTASRRRARELEDLRSKVREIQRELKQSEEEKDELTDLQKDWKKRREDLEHQTEIATKEAEEVRRAMSTLRDALDESEKQARESEKQKSDLRRNIEEIQQRLDRAQKSNKLMAEEVKSIQARPKPHESQDHSVRSSIDSSRPISRGLTSPPIKNNGQTPSTSTETVNGQPATSTDYLKNVLLQFLEQKDKKHQMQLVPVLGTLLHFDRKDEQKWMAAISAR